MNPGTSPSARSAPGVAYDTREDRLVLFGGDTGAGYTDETWTYDATNNSWNRSRAAGPAARGGHAMAYDSRSGVVIMFGGSTATGLSRTTWTYDLGTDAWTNRNPTVRPGVRFGHAMAYDVASDRLILFGGNNGTAYKGETYAYDPSANSWTAMSPPSAPSSRAGHAMAYDVHRDRVVLFGGRSDAGPNNETWTYSFSSNTWTNMNPVSPPAPRWNHSMAYDSRSGRVLLFGGLTGQGPTNETWTYDLAANAWRELSVSPGPQPRQSATLAYDEKADVYLMFGGVGSGVLGDTWTYRFYAPRLPSAPRSLQATPGDGRVQLAWELPADDGYARIAQYRVYRNGSFLVELGDVLGYRDDPLANGVTYLYRVSAVNAIGEGAPSGPVSAFPAHLFVFAHASPASGDAPLDVSFTSAVFGGFGPRTYLWAFGDGNVSDLANPSHTYGRPGVYTATLRVTDGRGVGADNATTVTVVPPLALTITTSPNAGFVPLAVAFRSEASGGVGPYTFQWGFGDGTTSTEPNPTHTYAVAGNYQVVLAVWDARGHVVTETIRVGANAPPPRARDHGVPMWPAAAVPIVFGIAVFVVWWRRWRPRRRGRRF